MYFQDVTPGEPWQVESAARYNAVNQLLSRADFQQTAMPPTGSFGGRILVRNASNAVLNVFTAVSPKIPLTGTPSDVSPEERAWDVLPAQNETLWWGILQQELAPQQCGEAVICGVTPAKISSSSVQGDKQYLAPGENGLEYRNSGRGELLGVRGNDSFALICLHGTSFYDGVFRLTKTAEGVDVGAGVALVNGVIFEVAAASLTCSGTGWIFLESIAGDSPTVGFSSSKPERSVPPGETASGVFPLGKLTETGIVQLCRSVPHILVLGEECTPCDEDE